MKTLDTSLLVFETASVAVGYRILDFFARAETVRILEAAPCGGGRFLILAAGSDPVLRDLSHHVRSALDGVGTEDLVDHEVIDQANSAVIESLFSLPQVPLEDSLIIVESATVSGLLPIAQALVASHGLKIIETKIQRSSRGGAYAFFTGSAKVCAPAAEDARTRLRGAMREGRVELIDAPAPAFRSFFNLSGDA